MKKTNKKKFLLILTVLTAVLVKVNIVDAATMTATLEIKGRNTFGRNLTLEYSCKDSSNQPVTSCYTDNIKWYYNTTNSTTGGTLIEGATTGMYKIDKSLVGKYIYVTADIKAGGYDQLSVSDITDETKNVSAVVGDYITNSDKKIKVTATATYETGARLNVAVDNFEDDGWSHYIYISKDGKPYTVNQTEDGCAKVDESYEKIDSFHLVSDKKIAIQQDWFMLKGYTTAYAYAQKVDLENGGVFCKVYTEPIEIAKPEIPAYDKRYKYYLFGNDTIIAEEDKPHLSVFPLFPITGKNGSHELNTKIGLITDKDILHKLAKNYDENLSTLIEYAKKADGKTYTYKDNEESYKIDLSSFEVVDGAYYYIYTTYTNTDDLYRDLDGITVVMGEDGMLVNNIKWEDSTTEAAPATPKTTVDNPKTGISIPVIVIIVGIISTSVIYLVTRKKKFYRV